MTQLLNEKLLDLFDKHRISAYWIGPGKEEKEALTKEELSGMIINAVGEVI